MANTISNSNNLASYYAQLSKSTQSSSETAKTASAPQTSSEYLKDLKKKYSDMNFKITDFRNERQEKEYMCSSRGFNNIAISPTIIEKMAKDPVTAAKYEKVISNVPKVAKELQERFDSDPNKKLISMGATIDKEGKVTYWCTSMSTDYGNDSKNSVQKMLEENLTKSKNKKKADEAKKEKLKEEKALEEKRLEKAQEKRAYSDKLKEMLSDSDDFKVIELDSVRKGLNIKI